jgi:hypothetical protein
MAESVVEELVATDDSVKIAETILEPVAESVADNDSVKIMGTIQELVAETVVEEYGKFLNEASTQYAQTEDALTQAANNMLDFK